MNKTPIPLFDIMTCTDSGYFAFALQLVRNLSQFSTCRIHVYDLGLTDAERALLCKAGASVHAVTFPADTFTHNSRNNIKTTHKINCIEDCLTHADHTVIALDADALVIEPVFEELKPAPNGFTVTYRCNREKKPHILINGKINAGVMAFDKQLSQDFFRAWRCVCDDPEHTDQSALSSMLDGQVDWERFNAPQVLAAGYTVCILDGNIYNDTTCRSGAIFHFKNAGRHTNKRIGFFIFARMLKLFPRAVAALVRANRRHGWLVWRDKV